MVSRNIDTETGFRTYPKIETSYRNHLKIETG